MSKNAFATRPKLIHTLGLLKCDAAAAAAAAACDEDDGGGALAWQWNDILNEFPLSH